MTTNEEVRKIAKLARLSFQETELNTIASQLTDIMHMLDVLNEVDCSKVEPLISVDDMQQRMRQDEVTSHDITDQLFANITGNTKKFAEKVKCFIVPRVME